ncbi:hypothetical protein NGA_0495800, partial [Nannochloropsis gaditana CCMP526]
CTSGYSSHPALNISEAKVSVHQVLCCRLSYHRRLC